jgi:fatty acid-binding protein DegV
LHVDDLGRLVPVEKVRGRKKSLNALVDNMYESALDPSEQIVFIGHGDCAEDAEFVKNQIIERMGVKDFLIHYIHPVIGAHSGPGTIALFFIGAHR